MPKQKLDSASFNQAWYLYRKLKRGDISYEMICKLFTDDGLIDLYGGWFSDFFYESLVY